MEMALSQSATMLIVVLALTFVLLCFLILFRWRASRAKYKLKSLKYMGKMQSGYWGPGGGGGYGGGGYGGMPGQG